MYPTDVTYTTPQPNYLGITLPESPTDEQQAEFNISQAASNLITTYVGRVLTQQQITCYWRIEESHVRLLQLPSWPVANKDKLTITDSDGTSYSYWFSKPNAIYLQAYPCVNTTMTLQYEGGYSKLPAEVVNAVRSVMQSLCADGSNYNAPTNFKAEGIDIAHHMPVKLLPYAVMTMLDGYKRIVI